MKYILTRKIDNVITHIVDAVEQCEQGLRVSENNFTYIIGFADSLNVNQAETLPAEVVIQKYKYDGSTFSVNENYIEPPKTPEQLLADDLATLKVDFNNAIMELSMAIAMTGTGV